VTDRQTDRRTDGIAMAYTRYSYAVAHKNYAKSNHVLSADPSNAQRNRLIAQIGRQRTTYIPPLT